MGTPHGRSLTCRQTSTGQKPKRTVFYFPALGSRPGPEFNFLPFFGTARASLPTTSHHDKNIIRAITIVISSMVAMMTRIVIMIVLMLAIMMTILSIS